MLSLGSSDVFRAPTGSVIGLAAGPGGCCVCSVSLTNDEKRSFQVTVWSLTNGMNNIGNLVFNLPDNDRYVTSLHAY